MIDPISGRPLRPANQVPAAAQSNRLLEAAREFEALFLEKILKEGRAANRGLSNEKTGLAQETYEEWQDQQFARSMASGSGIGLAEMIYRQLGGDAAAKQATPVAGESAKEPEGKDVRREADYGSDSTPSPDSDGRSNS